MVELTAPYIPGFLAFREVPFLVEKVDKLRQLHPQMTPQVIDRGTITYTTLNNASNAKQEQAIINWQGLVKSRCLFRTPIGCLWWLIYLLNALCQLSVD